MAMKEGSGLPEYYAKTYEKWYRWFSYVYDPFASLMLFVFNGGFGGERRIRQQAIDWLDPRPGERILDICSGTGTLTIMLGAHLAGEGDAVGIEVSSAQLRVTGRKPIPEGVSFVRADAQNIPFADAGFDKAVIFGALHEMPREVRRNVLSQAFRVIKPGGRLVATEHNKPDSRWKASFFAFLERFNPEYPTYRDLLESGLASEIERAGFRILKRRTLAREFFETILAGKEIRCDTKTQ